MTADFWFFISLGLLQCVFGLANVCCAVYAEAQGWPDLQRDFRLLALQGLPLAVVWLSAANVAGAA